MGCVYQARNRENGKCYIGMTARTLEIRRKEHEIEAIRGLEYAFHRALRKYGLDVFEWRVLFMGDNKEELFEWEIACIHNGKTHRNKGYNETQGGDGIIDSSGEIARKISKSHIGKKASPETIEKLRASHLGKPHSPETRVNQGRAQKGRKILWGDKIGNALRGRKHTEEQIRKNREGHLGKKDSQETIEKKRIASTGKRNSPESIKKQADKIRGRPKSEAHRAALRKAWEKRSRVPWNKGMTIQQQQAYREGKKK